MSSLPGYDRWKTSPPDDPPECEACDGAGFVPRDGEMEECRECRGTGIPLNCKRPGPRGCGSCPACLDFGDMKCHEIMERGGN
jgi:hypothetical protein